MTQKLVIAGDSWSQGEFNHFPEDNNRTIQTHPGTHQFILEEFPDAMVRNYGMNADNNTHQAKLLKQELPFMKPDAIIFFWTCPLREVANKLVKREIPGDRDTLKLHNLLNLISTEALNSMGLLNDLGVPILMIGGHVDLDMDNFLNYKNLIPLIPRAKALLPNSYGPIPPSTIDYNTLEGTVLIDCIDAGLKPPPLNPELLEQLKVLYKENFCWEEHPRDEFLFPDVSHGSRLIHKEISNAVADWLRKNLPDTYS